MSGTRVFRISAPSSYWGPLDATVTISEVEASTESKRPAPPTKNPPAQPVGPDPFPSPTPTLGDIWLILLEVRGAVYNVAQEVKTMSGNLDTDVAALNTQIQNLGSVVTATLTDIQQLESLLAAAPAEDATVQAMIAQVGTMQSNLQAAVASMGTIVG